MRVPTLAKVLLCGMGSVYIAFLALDIFWPGAVMAIAALKYAGMLLCMALAAAGSRQPWQKQDARLVLIALGFTLVADALLLFTVHFTLGVAIFCGAHLTYLYRYRRAVFVPALALASIVLAIVVAATLLGKTLPVLYIVGGFYAALILSVTVTVFASALPRLNRRLASAGMVLFLLCDVNVLLFNVLPRGAALYPVVSVLMWFFYLPAQALLALSCYDLSSAIAHKIFDRPEEHG